MVLHAGILLVAAGALIWVARELANLFMTTAQKTAEAEQPTAPKPAPPPSTATPKARQAGTR